MAYENGLGVKQNLKEALVLYALAARQQSYGAQSNFGRCLEQGIGVVPSPQAARHWYQLAAGHGDSYAQERLAALG
jgi:TPR repeat protein